MRLKITIKIVNLISVFFFSSLNFIFAQSKNISLLYNQIMPLQAKINVNSGHYSNQKDNLTDLNYCKKRESASNVYAIIIGVSKYKYADTLQYADKDALLFADYLLSKDGMGADSSNIHLFTNEEARMENISNALSLITENEEIEENDKFFFYFSGHGDYDPKRQKDEALLLLYNAPAKDFFKRNLFGGDFLVISDLYKRFFKRIITEKRCQVFLIADACHAAKGEAKVGEEEEGGRVTHDVLERIGIPTRFLSCKANQKSIEKKEYGGGHGLFTYVLMEGLYGLADTDNDKTVTIKELERYLEDSVKRLAEPHIQEPVIYTKDKEKKIASVNSVFLNSYIQNKKKNIFFPSMNTNKGLRQSWLQKLFASQPKYYKDCMRLIEKNQTDSAFNIFKKYVQKDSVSKASIEVRYALSIAFQKRAVEIVLPMAQKINAYLPDRQSANLAYQDLSKALYLIGPNHYLANQLKARGLFLKALAISGDSLKSRITEIVGYLQESISLEPNAPYCYFLLGNIFQKNNQQDSAAYYYQQYIDLIPNSSWAYTNIGLVYAELGNFEKAKQSYEKALSIDGTDGKAYNNLALIYMRNKDYLKAVYQLRSATAYWQDSEIPFLNLAKACYETHDYVGSLQALNKAYAINQKAKVDSLNVGEIYYQNGLCQLALNYFEKEARLKKMDFDVLVKIGDCFLNDGSIFVANDYYKRALQIKPKNQVVIKKYASALEIAIAITGGRGQWYEAERMCKEYANIYPKEPRIWISLANNFIKSGNVSGGINCFKRGEAIFNKNRDGKESAIIVKAIEQYVTSLFDKATDMLLHKQYDYATQAFLEFHRLKPQRLDALMYAADAFFKLKKYDKSLIFYSKVYHANNKSLAALEGMANVSMAEKKYAIALKLYKQLFNPQEKNNMLHFKVATCYAGIKNVKESCNALANAFKTSDPSKYLSLIETTIEFNKIRKHPQFQTYLKERFPSLELVRHPYLFRNKWTQ
jgi:protein O-mannosyl-transferase